MISSTSGLAAGAVSPLHPNAGAASAHPAAPPPRRRGAGTPTRAALAPALLRNSALSIRHLPLRSDSPPYDPYIRIPAAKQRSPLELLCFMEPISTPPPA